MENPAVASATPPAQPEKTGEAANPQYVTVEQLGRVERKINALFAEQRQSGKKTETPAAQENGDEPLSVRQELDKIRSEIRTEREHAARELRDSAITSAIASHGLDADNAEILEAFV